MSAKITQIEDALITTIKTTLGNTVRTVEWAPPDWDEDFIKRALLAVPGVFVIFGGGPRNSASDHTVIIDTQWTVAAVTRHVQEPKLRARGDLLEIGCYQILEILAPVLNGLQLPNVGTLELTAWDNDAALKLDKQSLMVQTLSFTMPVELEPTLDPSALVPFETYHDTFNIEQLPGAPTTEDYVELPQ